MTKELKSKTALFLRLCFLRNRYAPSGRANWAHKVPTQTSASGHHPHSLLIGNNETNEKL